MTVEEYFQYITTEAIGHVRAATDERIKLLQTSWKQAVALLQADFTASQAPKGGIKKLFVGLRALSGPHSGTEWLLCPTQRRLVPKLGRSTSDQFTKNGVSLPDDSETSTAHGKFEVRAGACFFTDTHSTNGTFIARGGMKAQPGMVSPTPGATAAAAAASTPAASPTSMSSAPVAPNMTAAEELTPGTAVQIHVGDCLQCGQTILEVVSINPA